MDRKPHWGAVYGRKRSNEVSWYQQFGDEFRLLRSVSEDHVTPMGTTQKFVYCVCSVEGAELAHHAA